jgi:hypothetical protein
MDCRVNPRIKSGDGNGDEDYVNPIGICDAPLKVRFDERGSTVWMK